MQPPPEVLLLPADATVGQLLEAATTAFREAYRMCLNWTAEAVVGGLSVTAPPPPAPPLGLPAPVAAAAAASPAAAEGGNGAAPMEVDPASPEAVAAATAAAAVSAAVAGADGAAANGTAAGGSGEAQVAAAMAAAAVSAAVAAQDGVPAAQQAQQVQQPQQAQQPAEQQAADPQRAQQEAEREALLARRLADLLLPPQQQGPGPAPAAGAGGSADAARAAATNGLQLPAVTVAGREIDWSVRWRHAGGCPLRRCILFPSTPALHMGLLSGNGRAPCSRRALVEQSPPMPGLNMVAAFVAALPWPQAGWRTGRSSAAAACWTTMGSA